MKQALQRVLFIFLALARLSFASGSERACIPLLSGSGFAKPIGLKEQTPIIDGTPGFIAYLGVLLQEQLIGNPELEILIDGIERRSEIVNPIPHEVSRFGVLFTKSAYQIHHEELQHYILHSRLDQNKILEWAYASLKENSRVRVRREETRIETQDVHQKMEFQRVEKGSFEMGEGRGKMAVALTHSFEAMTTLVTQKMWVDDMGENPSRFQVGENTVEVSKNGKQIKMQPDNPVENITWWSAIVFANKQSEKMGLAPVYDLTQIIDWDGSPELGTYKPRDEERAKQLLKINAPNGDIYQADGVRLPTEAEQEFMCTDRGRSQGKYFSGITEDNLKDSAWFDENSRTQIYPNGTTHPVAALAPQVIDGKEFYDLHGNAWEWGHDRWDGSTRLIGGTDPHSEAGPYRVVRGGSWYNYADALPSAQRNVVDPGERYGSVGVRFVRTVK